jgi:hypothetical protein
MGLIPSSIAVSFKSRIAYGIFRVRRLGRLVLLGSQHICANEALDFCRDGVMEMEMEMEIMRF